MALFSVNTNVGALAALQSLDETQEALTQAQNEVSTGQSVSSASDNPAIYSISNSINSNIAGLSAVSASLNFGAQIVATATNAIASVNTVLESLQQTVTSAGQTGINLTTLQNAVVADLASINAFATQSTFTGVNLLTTQGDGQTNTSLNVVQGLDGSVYSVANQATTLNTNATTLTDALNLSNLSVLAGGTSGVQVAFDNSLSVGSFAPASSAATTPAPDTDAALQLTTGTGATAHTYSFEFTDDGATTSIPLQTQQNANTTIIAVHINSTTQSTNQIVGALVTAIRSNGFGVVQNTDGSLNITGANVTAGDFGTVSGGQFTSTAGTPTAPSTTSGVNFSTLTGTTALVSAVQAAVVNSNTIAANLGSISQQITGIQNFTSSLSSALTVGVGALTDADLAAESARLTSLQTKQQLATQSLAIANKQPQVLLTLFQGL
jgi:flagellin